MGDHTLEAMLDGMWRHVCSLRPISSGVLTYKTLRSGFWVSMLWYRLAMIWQIVRNEMQSCHVQLQWTHVPTVGRRPSEERTNLGPDSYTMRTTLLSTVKSETKLQYTCGHKDQFNVICRPLVSRRKPYTWTQKKNLTITCFQLYKPQRLPKNYEWGKAIQRNRQEPSPPPRTRMRTEGTIY
jgi:hypothetical protein